MLDFILGDNKLSLPMDSFPDDTAEKIQVFLESVRSDYDRGQQRIAHKDEALNHMLSLSDATINTFAQGAQLKDEIQQLFQEDLTSLQQSNPTYARHVSTLLVQKQLELTSVVTELDQQEKELAQALQVEVELRRDEGVSILDQKYDNFSTVKAPELVKYAISKGMSPRNANGWAQNPVVAEMGFKAMLYDQGTNQ